MKRIKKQKKRIRTQHFQKPANSAAQNISLSKEQALGLAVQHLQAGNLLQAEHLIIQILNVDPNNAEANHLLGVIFAQQGGKSESAIHHIRRAIQANPYNAAFHHNLGLILDDLGRREGAITSYRTALAINPDYAEAHNNLGVVLQEAGNPDEAEQSFKHALALKPNFAEAHGNLGFIYMGTGRLDEAFLNYREALVLKPDMHQVHSNLVYAMNCSPDFSQKEIFEESLVFAKRFARKPNRTQHILPPGDICKRKLRIGYISPDFWMHSVSYFFEPLLKAHDRDGFEIFCYSDVKKPDAATKRIEEETDHWIPITGKMDDEVAEMIQGDRINILVELTGHMRDNRLSLLASKPAPVQVSWLGYPNTTGLQEIDYRLSDATADPVSRDDDYYSEKLIRLQDCFLCYQPFEQAPEVSASPCLKSSTITFGSFNFLAKVNSEVVRLWAEILLKVPGSRLILKASLLNAESVQKRFLQMFSGLGVASERIELLGMIEDKVEHLSAYNRVDIALDPFPYNGTTTTCEALWMGVPVVTLGGERHSGRVGASILHTIGMVDLLVADDKESYIEKAVGLAKDTKQLAIVRKSLRQKMQDSPLCNAESFARKVEAAYKEIWVQYTGNTARNIQEKNSSKNLLHNFQNSVITTRQAQPFDQTYQSAVAYFNSGNLRQAEYLCLRILQADPDNADANHLLGVVVGQQEGKQEAAIEYYKKALSCNSDNIITYNNLGVLLLESGKFNEAEENLRKAISLNPNFFEAYVNLGTVLKELQSLEEAESNYRQALSHKPNDPIVNNNLGAVLQESGKLEEAERCLKRNLSLNPYFADSYCNLGIVYRDQCKLDEAIASFRKALVIKPDFNFAYSNLVFAMNYSPDIPQKEIFKESVAFGKMFARNLNRSRKFFLQDDHGKPKLRIGYISPDFRRHSVAYFFEPLLTAHNREDFEIFCYSDVKKPDEVTKRIQEKADLWIPIAGNSDADVIDKIKGDRIDILVELAGHTRNNRLPLLALKPAPVQVSWLGHPNTTGLQEIDYRFTDAIADPVGRDDDYYSEELIRLLGGFLCYQPFEHAPEVSKPPCLESDTITFGSFNFLTKVTPEVVKLWAEILLKVPGSRLILKARQLNDESVKNRYVQMFDELGITSDRIELLGMIEDTVEHLAAYNRVDIALDPFPYNGTTTTCEALWMGVPVITLRGDRHSGRVGASILHAIGMEELLVAEDKESYVAIAVAWAKDTKQLASMRKNLRQKMQESPLCDAASFAKKVEKAYQDMWARFKEDTSIDNQAEDSSRSLPQNLQEPGVTAQQTFSPEQTYQSAIQNYQSGKLIEAEELCQQLLHLDSDNADVNHLAGIIEAKQGGKFEAAIHHIRKAIQVEPDNVDFHNNLGSALQMSGQFEEAIVSYRKALSLKYDSAEVHKNLGIALKDFGRSEESVTSFMKALALKSDYAEAHNGLGAAFQNMNKFDEAIKSYEKAISINPEYEVAYNNLGNVFKSSGRPNKAIESFRKALELKPDYAEAHNNLGVVFQEAGKLDEAERSFGQALVVKPDFAEAHSNLGIVYKEQCRLKEAIFSYRKALALKPDLNLVYSNLVFAMNYSSAAKQKDIFEESLAFAKMYSGNENRRKHIPSQSDLDKRKLRIGYVSPDFRIHSVSYFFEPLLKAHDRGEFEIYCYSDVKKNDEVTDIIQAEADHWVSISGNNDAEVIEMIKRDRIDIFVELTGHTRNNRLAMLALKPAPIQVSWLGYPNTTGLEEIDYRFTDAIADPVGIDDDYYSEELIRLQDCFLCYQPFEHAPDVSSPPCLASDTITFGSFNFLTKVTPEVVKVWAEILVKVPNSRLVLKAKQLGDGSVKARYLEMFDGLGVSSDRIDMLGMIEGTAEHLATYNRIDIALDPFPYNGTTTTCEALWMGVPVVSLLGDRHSGRVGASVLHTLGMADLLVVESVDSYVEKAVGFAKDKEQLENIRKNLRQQMQESPLCDATSFAKNIEAAYQNMWAKYTGSYNR